MQMLDCYHSLEMPQATSATTTAKLSPHLGISTFPTDLHIIEVVVIVSQKSLCFHLAFAKPEPEMCHQSSHLCI